MNRMSHAGSVFAGPTQYGKGEKGSCGQSLHFGRTTQCSFIQRSNLVWVRIPAASFAFFLCFLRVFGLPVLTSVERISFSSIEGLELTSPFCPQSMTHLPPATSNGTRNQIRCQSRFSQKLFVKLKFVQSSLRQLAHFHDTFCEIALMCTSHLWVAGGYSASAGDETVFRAL